MKVNKWLIVISVVIIIVPTIIMVTNVINAFNSAETARGKAMKALEKIENYTFSQKSGNRYWRSCRFRRGLKTGFKRKNDSDQNKHARNQPRGIEKKNHGK